MGVWVDLIDRKLTFDSKILDHFFYKSCPSRPKLSGTLVHEKIQLTQFLNMASDSLDPFLNKTFTWIPEPFIRPVRWWSRNLCLKAVFLFHTTIISSLMNIFLKSQVNGSTLKSPLFQYKHRWRSGKITTNIVQSFIIEITNWFQQNGCQRCRTCFWGFRRFSNECVIRMDFCISRLTNLCSLNESLIENQPKHT